MRLEETRAQPVDRTDDHWIANPTCPKISGDVVIIFGPKLFK